MTDINVLRQFDLKTLCINNGLHLDKDDKTQFKNDVFRIRINGFKWFDHHHGVGGGGAIDLVRHLLKVSYSEACQYLNNADPFLYSPTTKTQVNYKNRATTPPESSIQNLSAVIAYLINNRGLNHDLVTWCINAGAIYADYKNNCVFRYGTKGAELRGTGKIQWRSIYGTIEQGFILPAKNAIGVAVLESAIDALSYRQLHKDVITISIAGNSNKTVMNQAGLIAKNRKLPLLSAFDNDQGGSIADKVLNEIALLYETIVIQDRPTAKDWNEQLKER